MIKEHDSTQALHWRNYIAPPLFELFWGAGIAVTYFQTVMPAFLDELNASRLVVGFVQSLIFVAAMVVQPLVGMLFPKATRPKFWAYALEGSGALCIAVLGLVVLYTPRAVLLHHGVPIFLALYVPFFLLANAGASFYGGLMIDLVPRYQRGTHCGWRVFLFGIGTMIGSKLVYPALAERLADSLRNYGLLFVAGGTTCFLATHVFFMLKDERTLPDYAGTNIKTLGHEWLADMCSLLRRRVFRRWLLVTVCLSVSFASTGFLTLYYKTRSTASTATTIATLTLAYWIMVTCGGLINGQIADRMGCKRVTLIMCVCYLVAHLMPVLAGDRIPGAVPFALVGYAHSGLALWRMFFLKELVPDLKATRLVTASLFLPAPFVVATMLLLGRILDVTGDKFVVVLAITATAAATALLCCALGIPEPRKAQD